MIILPCFKNPQSFDEIVNQRSVLLKFLSHLLYMLGAINNFTRQSKTLPLLGFSIKCIFKTLPYNITFSKKYDQLIFFITQFTFKLKVQVIFLFFFTNFWFSDLFRGYTNRTLARNELFIWKLQNFNTIQFYLQCTTHIMIFNLDIVKQTIKYFCQFPFDEAFIYCLSNRCRSNLFQNRCS